MTEEEWKDNKVNVGIIVSLKAKDIDGQLYAIKECIFKKDGVTNIYQRKGICKIFLIDEEDIRRGYAILPGNRKIIIKEEML
ncbi:MAG: hypothetical protein DRN17_00295 [Thermoplasmata archaeon]|nr:MAG: hypothetical protein DRN17_00295 [Thermoplasmata archaeon]